MAAPAQRHLRRALLGASRLGRGVLAAEGGSLGGLTTYRMKLPLELQGSPADRWIASELGAVSLRLRLQHMASLLATGLAPLLAARPGAPVSLLDVAGGPSADALNALILLRRDQPGALERRRIEIQVLDRDRDGPVFAARALDALASGGPLTGPRVTLRHVEHEWTDRAALESILGALPPDAIVAVSSEGGLVEYGDDETIAANLEALRDRGPPDAIFVASVTRADGAAPLAKAASGVRTRPRTLEGFRRLAVRSGFVLDRVEETPLSFDVRLARG